MAKTEAELAAEKAAKDAAKAEAAAKKEADDKAKAEADAAEKAAKDAAATPKVDAERQARWKAFLAKAEEQAEEHGTLHIFNAQKERGEFKEIPASFV